MRFLRGILIFLPLLLLPVGISVRVPGDNEPAVHTLKGQTAAPNIEKVDPSIGSALPGKGIRIAENPPARNKLAK